MLVEVVPTYDAMSDRALEIVATQLREKPDSVIGFATGSTPAGLYSRLVDEHRGGRLDFAQVTTFNLDEYVGLPPDHAQSYHHFMWSHLFAHINVDPSRVHIPGGTADGIDETCRRFEEAIEQAGGIDLQVLGIGANGHLAFNEPGSSLGSRTRPKPLTESTIRDNARLFDDPEEVPRHAITMGIGTIMDARQLLLLASGEGKANAMHATLEGPITAMVPATIVQLHPHAHVIVDDAAASNLEYKHHHGIMEPYGRRLV